MSTHIEEPDVPEGFEPPIVSAYEPVTSYVIHERHPEHEAIERSTVKTGLMMQLRVHVLVCTECEFMEVLDLSLMKGDVIVSRLDPTA